MEFIRKKTKEPMKEMTQDGVTYLQFEAFRQFSQISHLFSTRIGGVSNGYLGSMNLSYSRGDEKENVDENFRRIAKIMHSSVEDFVLSDQTHTTNIRVVTKKDKGKGIVNPRDYHDIDGLVTNEPGIVLSTFFADCVPLYFVDPIKNVIALSHSGWRGTVNRIGEKTVQTMLKQFQCHASDIYAAIGPSICAECYEVDYDVAKQFLDEFHASKAAGKIVREKEDGKYLLDLWTANLEVLCSAGIPKNQIAVTDICTCCNHELLYSHRASHGKRGNLGAFLKLN